MADNITVSPRPDGAFDVEVAQGGQTTRHVVTVPAGWPPTSERPAPTPPGWCRFRSCSCSSASRPARSCVVSTSTSSATTSPSTAPRWRQRPQLSEGLERRVHHRPVNVFERSQHRHRRGHRHRRRACWRHGPSRAPPRRSCRPPWRPAPRQASPRTRRIGPVAPPEARRGQEDGGIRLAGHLVFSRAHDPERTDEGRSAQHDVDEPTGRR